MTSVQSPLLILEPYIEAEDHCSEGEVKKLSALERHEANRVQSFLFDQPPFEEVEPVFALYSINQDGSGLRKVTDIYSLPTLGNHVTIQSSDSQVLLHIYSPVSLAQYLRLLSSRRYAFISAGLGAEGEEDDHQTLLCMDLEKRLVYLLDPNGSTTYFDRLFGYPLESLIERLLAHYFEEMADFGSSFIFVPRASWNHLELSVNRSFAGTDFSSGNCVVTSYMIAHYLVLTGGEPIEPYISFQLASRADLLYFVNGYTKMLYRACFEQSR
jgi:hypothetical protein